MVENCEILSKLWNLVKIVKSGQNCEIWSKLWNLVKIVMNLGRGYVMNVGRGYVIQHSQWVSNEGGYRAARAAKNVSHDNFLTISCWSRSHIFQDAQNINALAITVSRQLTKTNLKHYTVKRYKIIIHTYLDRGQFH